jgi:hypothetical protein
MSELKIVGIQLLKSNLCFLSFISPTSSQFEAKIPVREGVSEVTVPSCGDSAQQHSSCEICKTRNCSPASPAAGMLFSQAQRQTTTHIPNNNDTINREVRWS